MKKAVKIIVAILIVFVAVNAIWFGWSRVKYGKLSRGMEENTIDEFLVPRYFYTDEEGYDFGVKYPDYLSLTGNVSVGTPAKGDNPFTDALIIWPKLFGGYEFGVLLYDDNGDGYCIYIDSDGNALSKDDEEVVSRHKENIEALLKKADEKWGII